MKKTGQLALAFGLGLSCLPTLAAAEPLKVVASFSILGDLAKAVGGDRVDVATLVGPDGDAHVYEPKPADAATMAKANVVLVNGLGFEGFIERLAKASATAATIVQVSSGIQPIGTADHAHDHDGGEEDAATGQRHDGIDPHAFQSVPNVRLYVKTIADVFCAADVVECPAFKANASAYDAKLVALDLEIRAVIASIPAERRTIITSHDAFGYFAHEYGVTFLAPEGISTDSEASAADVARLIDQVRADNASALFVETISDPRLVNQISNETGIKVGGALYSDALSRADGPAATYIEMMRYNVETIKGAILGS